MFGSGTLDLLIGLVFLYFVLSVVCSSMMEALASICALRAQTLHQAIDALLDQTGVDLNEFFNSPHIAPLAKDYVPDTDKTKFPSRGKGIPAYIPADRFTTALLEQLSGSSSAGREATTSFAKLRDLSARWEEAPKSGLANSKQDAKVLKPIMPPARAALQSFMARVTSELPVSASDGARLARLRQYLDRWYADTMDRAAGWYKRKTQVFIFIFGAALCGCFNIDSIRVMERLSHDATTRTMMSQAALAATQPAQPVGGDTTRNAQDTLHRQLAEVDQAGLPLGWSQEVRPNAICAWFWYIVTKALGLGITAFAISMGAPFWFGLLSKLVELRNAGDKPAPPKSPVAPMPIPPSPDGDGGSSVTLLPADYWHAAQRSKDWDGFSRNPVDVATVAGAAMARCSLLAYSTDVFVRSVLQASWGVEADKYRTFLQPGGTQAFVMQKGDFSVVAFRGTQGEELADIVDDACCQMIAAKDLGEGQVSVGFAASLDALTAQLDSALKELGAGGKRIFVTGHSLGGALATLYASHLAAGKVEGVSGDTAYLFTYGAPRVGDAVFASSLESALGYKKTQWQQAMESGQAKVELLSQMSRVFRFVDHNDVVTRVPFDDAFAHAGPSLYLTAGGTVDLTMIDEKRFGESLVDVVRNFRELAISSVKDHSCEKYLMILEACTQG